MEEKQPQNPELLQIDRQYKRDVALVEARPLLQRLGVIFWWSLDIGLVAFFVIYLVYSLFFGSANTQREAAKVVNNIQSTHAITLARAADPLVPGSARVIESETGKFDYYVQVYNPNSDWLATFSYYFTSSSGETKQHHAFVLPGENKYLLTFAESSTTRPLNTEVVIEDLSWQRIDAKETNDVAAWLAEHQKFTVENVSHEASVQLGGEAITRTSFTITNNSAFSYWSPEFSVLLGRSGALVGVNTVTIPGFESGETRVVNVNWFGNVPTSASVEIVPNIDFFDDEVYMTPTTETPTDLRDLF